MKYIDLLYGFLIGWVTAFIGAFLYLFIFTPYNLFTDFKMVLDAGILGLVLKLGAILNLAVFFILLKFDKDSIAQGIIATFIVLAILAFFI
ncbi:MAG: hypothetical protein V4548_09465 [Bacteroidota bacterium]